MERVAFGDRTIPNTRTHPRARVLLLLKPERDERVLCRLVATMHSVRGPVCRLVLIQTTN